MSEWFWKKISEVTGWLTISVLFGLIVFAANIEIKDLDLWLHLATGRFIVDNHLIPRVDILSSAIAGQPWINHEWLFQILIYWVYNLSGIDGWSTLQVLVVTFTFVLLLFLGYQKEKQLTSIFLLLLILLVYQNRFLLRPEIFSTLFFTLYVYILALYIDRRWSVGAICVIQVLWGNMHGFFILGPMTLLIALGAEWAKRSLRLPFEWSQAGRLEDDEYKRLKVMFFAAIVACLINPHFLKGALYPISVLFSLPGESKVFFQKIAELQKPVTMDTLFSLGRYPYYKLLIILSSLSFVWNRRRIDVGIFFFWLFFLLLSLNAVRNIAFFAVASYFVILSNVQEFSIHRFLPEGLRNAKLRSLGSMAFKIFLMVWMIGYIGQLSLKGYFDFDNLQRKSEYAGMSLRNYPYKAADFLVDNKIKGNFFNDFNSGAYLLGRTHPDIKVFIDGRTEVYGVKHFQQYRKAWKGDKSLFDKLADQYQLTGVFLNAVYQPAPAVTMQNLYKDEKWILVYFDYDAAIFLLDVPKNKDWIDQHAIDLAKWQTEEADLMALGARNLTPYRYVNRANALYNLEFYDKAQKEAREALRITPHYGEPYKLLGKINLKEKEFAKAYENFRKAKLLRPGESETRYLLAYALYYLGDYKAAHTQCEIVLENNIKNAKGLFLMTRIYAQEKKYDRAFMMFKKGHQLAPHALKEFASISDLFIEQDERPWAKKILTLALKTNPDDREIQDKLGSLNE